MNKLDKQYTDLLQDILEHGTRKMDRTGTGTISVFGRQIRHKMSDGFPLLTTKKMAWKTMVTELIWFLRGDTNIKFLVDNNCHIWDGDAWKNYQHKASKQDFLKDGVLRYDGFINKIKTDDEFAKKWGELGPVYGKQWRKWKTRDTKSLGGTFWGPTTEITENSIDQIANSINLLKTDPDSRRNRVNAWNVGELDQMVLPPCHTDFQFFTRVLSWGERMKILKTIHPLYHMEQQLGGEDILTRNNIPNRAISLMWNQRSVDTFLGLPFNIASYGLLLEIIAKEVNMVPDELIGNLGDTHLYLNHVEQAKEQIGRELSLEERTELAKGKVVPLLGSKEDSYNEAGIPTRTREPYPLPTLVINDEFWNPDTDLLSNLPHIKISDFYVDNYQSHPTIKAPLSN